MHKMNIREEIMLYRISLSALPELCEIYEIERKTVWRCADRRNILVHITDGSCLFEIDGDELLLTRGETLLIPAGQEYTRRPANDALCRFVYLHFRTDTPICAVTEEEATNERRTEDENAEPGVPVTRRVLFFPQVSPVGQTAEQRNALLHKIITERYAHMGLSRTFSAIYLCEFLAFLASESDINGSAKTGIGQHLPRPLREALLYIRQNYDRKITTEDLCRHCGLSPQHLIRLFRKHLGTTPIQYINRNKIMHAIEMLRTSELTVKEIAYSLGYDNPNYFSRLFTKLENTSPRACRERIRSYSDTLE